MVRISKQHAAVYSGTEFLGIHQLFWHSQGHTYSTVWSVVDTFQQ